MSGGLIAMIAALSSSMLWAWSTIGFRGPLLRHGPLACSFFKAALGTVLFGATAAGLALATPVPWPSWTDGGWLLISGVCGMALGDLAYFAAIVRIGVKPATLLMSTAPLFLLAFSFTDPGDALTGLEMLGVVLVVGGVLDVTRHRTSASPEPSVHRASGHLLGLLAALGQAVGIVLAKDALADCHVVVAAGIRLAGASAGFFVTLVLWRACRRVLGAVRDADLWRTAAAPVLAGTYLGVGAMMVAIAHGKTAVAGALLSLTPVFIVPLATLLLGERFEVRVMLGTLVAVAGVVVMGWT